MTRNNRKVEDFSWSYKGFECIARIENDCPYIWAQQRYQQSPVTWVVDFPSAYFWEKLPFELALDDCVLKLEMLIDASCADPLIKKRLPKGLFDGYTFQCSRDDLKELLDKLVPAPGQLSLFGDN
jgi:hypothetical protein